MTSTIFINGRFLTKSITGVQRYAFELLSQMDLLLEEAEYRNLRLVCLAPPELGVLPAWKNLEIRRVGRNRGNLWEQIDLPFHSRGNLLFSPANQNILGFSALGPNVICSNWMSKGLKPDKAFLDRLQTSKTTSSFKYPKKSKVM